MFHDLSTFLRTWSSFFCLSLLWLFPPLLFHLSILSEVWLLNFLRSCGLCTPRHGRMRCFQWQRTCAATHAFLSFESLSLLSPIHTCLPRRFNAPHLLHLEGCDPTLTRVGINVSEDSQQAKSIVANGSTWFYCWAMSYEGFCCPKEWKCCILNFESLFWTTSVSCPVQVHFSSICWFPSASASPQVQVPGIAIAVPRARAVPLTSRFVSAQPAGSQRQALLRRWARFSYQTLGTCKQQWQKHKRCKLMGFDFHQCNSIWHYDMQTKRYTLISYMSDYGSIRKTRIKTRYCSHCSL